MRWGASIKASHKVAAELVDWYLIDLRLISNSQKRNFIFISVFVSEKVCFCLYILNIEGCIKLVEDTYIMHSLLIRDSWQYNIFLYFQVFRKNGELNTSHTQPRHAMPPVKFGLIYLYNKRNYIIIKQKWEPLIFNGTIQ